jgi:hypothetical protein
MIEAPHLPPSPSTLARPIASRTLIDPELLTSLRIIWGRHADSLGESIIKDLCSPAGEGVHAKAFYFLLRQYRDDSMRQNPSEKMPSETDDIGKSRANFNLGWELDSSVVNKKYTRIRSHMLTVDPPPYSRNPGSVLVAPSMRRRGSAISGISASRDRAPSPAGPRAPKGRTNDDRMTQTSNPRELEPAARIAQPGSGLGRGGPRPRPPHRGYTYSQPTAKANVSTVQFPQPLEASELMRQRRPRSALDFPASDLTRRKSMLASSGNPHTVGSDTSTPGSAGPVSLPAKVIHAPTPISVSRKYLDLGTSVDPDSLPSSCPQSSTAISGHDFTVGPLSTQTLGMPSDADPHGECWNQTEPAHARGRRTSPRVASRIYEGKDKENYVFVEPRTTASAEEPRKRPVGLGMGREVGRNMGNITHLADGEVIKGKKEKDKKTRRRHFLLSSSSQIKRPFGSSHPGFSLCEPETINNIVNRISHCTISASERKSEILTDISCRR